MRIKVVADEKSGRYFLPFFLACLEMSLMERESLMTEFFLFYGSPSEPRWSQCEILEEVGSKAKEGDEYDFTVDISDLSDWTSECNAVPLLNGEEKSELFDDIKENLTDLIAESIIEQVLSKKNEHGELSEAFSIELLEVVGENIITPADMKVAPEVIKDVLSLFIGREIDDYNKFLMNACITGVLAKLPELAEWHSLKEK